MRLRALTLALPVVALCLASPAKAGDIMEGVPGMSEATVDAPAFQPVFAPSTFIGTHLTRDEIIAPGRPGVTYRREMNR